MPRKQQPHSREAVLARAVLQEYLRKERLSANALAQRAGVGQPTLCRFLAGRTKTVTSDIETVLRYAHIEVVNDITLPSHPLDNATLREALARAWDGTLEGAELLAHLIEALGPVVSRHLSTISRRTP